MSTCEVCGKKVVSICSSCYSGYYCSQECQRVAWPQHKLSCAQIKNTTVRNPWYAPVSPTEPAPIDPKHASDESVYEDLKFVNTTRGPKGESLLHIAVVAGDVEAVRLFLSSLAFVDSLDWWSNTPLYYACSHGGDVEHAEETPKPDTVESPQSITELSKTRLEIVQVLIDAGANTMQQGGYSGLRPAEAAIKYGYPEVAELIEKSPQHALTKKIRALVNKSANDISRELLPAVKKTVDIHWRAETCHWLIQPNRFATECFNPHPGMLACKTLEDVEKLFQDIQERVCHR
jgi:hypothetical protein